MDAREGDAVEPDAEAYLTAFAELKLVTLGDLRKRFQKDPNLLADAEKLVFSTMAQADRVAFCTRVIDGCRNLAEAEAMREAA